MAIQLAGNAVLVGTGVVGTILTLEGRLFDVPSYVFSALKIFRKHFPKAQGSSSSPGNGAGIDNLKAQQTPTGSNNSVELTLQQQPSSHRFSFFFKFCPKWSQQVAILIEEIKRLQVSGPVTIVTESRSGLGRYNITAIVVVGVIGCVYIRWKGWKLSEMMFVTKRSFSEVTNNVGKQLDEVSLSVQTTKKDLVSRINHADSTLQDCLEVSAATKKEVSILGGDLIGLNLQVDILRDSVHMLNSKLVRMEENTDYSTQGVFHLCQAVKTLESRSPDNNQVLRSYSARPAIQLPQSISTSRSELLLPIVSAEPPMPSTPREASRVLLSSRTLSGSSFKEVQGLTVVGTASMETSSSEPGNSVLSSGAPLPSEDPSRNGALISSDGPSRNGALKVLEESSSSGIGASISAKLGYTLPSIFTRTQNFANRT